MSLYVDIQREAHASDIPDDSAFNQWVTLALKGRRGRGEICIRIVEPAESQELNSTYRGKDKPTNVLSFPFEAPAGVPNDIIGDLAICADIVRQEAEEQQKTLANHWAHMVIHGCLHLIGFDHIDDSDAQEMEALETQLLATLNIPDPYLQGE
jgi:probable rRNA maturation factor